MATSAALSGVASLSNAGMTWTDITDPTRDELTSLAAEHGFDRLDIEDALSPRELTKVEAHGDHMFVCLLIPAQGPQGLIIARHFSMFIGKDFLVTLHSSKLEVVSQIFQRCRTDQKEREELMRSPPFLGYRIADTLLNGIWMILDNVQASLDRIEAVVFNEKKSSARAINETRRQIAVLRRMVYPLVLYLPDLTQSQKFSKDDMSIYFNDIRHKIGKISRLLDGMKEMVEIYNDTDFVTSSNRTNTVLAVLTIIFTLTLPATVLSGLYGMNVPLPGGLIPGPAEFLGTFTSLILILSAMLVATTLMTVYFKRAGWF